MQVLQRFIQNIRQSVGHMPANAKLLLGSMTIILIMAILLVSQYAGEEEMMPLGLATASNEVRADAASFLETARIPYEDRGTDIYVPAEERLQVLGRLNEQQIVSAGEINFNSLIEMQSNPLIGSAQSQQMLLIAKMNVLGAIISGRRDVARAQVVIDQPTGVAGIGSRRAPRASVSITMRGGELTQEAADAIGNLIATSQAGLSLEDITVTDIGSLRSFKPRTIGGSGSSGYLEHKQKTEEHYQEMIERFMHHIPGAIVTVNAVVRNTRETRKETTLDDPKIAPSTSEVRDFSATNNGTGGVAGAGSNVAARISGGNRSSDVTESTSREQKESRFGGSEVVIQDDTGYAIQVNAVVGIPRSFFVRLYQQAQGDAEATPGDAELDPIVQQQTGAWEKDLALLVQNQGLDGAVPGEVRVRMIHDFDAPLASAPFGAAAVGGGVFEAVTSNGSLIKNIGLGALALLSLFMMFIMVRRANHSAALASAEIPRMQGDQAEIIGEAGEGEAALDALEVDDAMLRTQQILKQINTMVDQEPADAAVLIERWITADVNA